MSARSMRRARERQIERETKTRSRLGRKLAVGTGAALGATVLFAPAAQAATFTVTKLPDTGDGTCNADCSLREAVEDANAAAGDDVVTFASGLSGEIALTAGIAVYNDGLQIQGPGAGQITVSGEDNDRIFKLFGFDAPDEQVVISGLTLSNGSTGGDGGAISSSGFIDSGGPDAFPADLSVVDSVITNSEADGVGGAIAVNGQYYDSTTNSFYSGFGGNLTVTRTTISGNSAFDGGGGINVENDETPGNLTIAGSTLSGNESLDDDGGGLYARAGTVDISLSSFVNNVAQYDGGGATIRGAEASTVRDSAFIGNEAGSDGGGLYTRDLDGAATVTGTTASGNSAADQGGGIYINDADFAQVVQNSTVSGNSADEGGGIGVDADADSNDDVTIRNSTVVNNTATTAAGGVYRDEFYSGPGAYGGDTAKISSTIVANNSAPTGPDLGQSSAINTGTSSFVLGFSLIKNPAGATTTENPAGSNITGVDPALGPLAFNGGPTQTHLPALSSPVIDAGVANGLATDQRGFPRTADLARANRAGSDGTDIGSVEILGEDCLGQGAVAEFRPTAGDDTIVGTGEPDAIHGLAGNDTITGLPANDCLYGDEGADTVGGDDGDDLIDGGLDADILRGGTGKDLVKGAAGRDKLRGQRGKDKLKGQGGKDNLAGGKGKDKLNGGKGKDKLKGGKGKDRLKGNAGNDRLKAVDGKRDKVNCGGGKKDRATVDAKDKVSANCEKVTVR